MALGVLAGAGSALADPPAMGDRPGLQIGTVQQLIYDSNVARTDSALASVRGVTPSEFIWIPELTVAFDHAFGPETLILKGTAGYDFHSSNQILNGERLDVFGSVKSRFGRCDAALSGDYARLPSTLDQLNVSVTHNEVTEETASLTAQCGGAVGLVPSVALAEQWASNSSGQIANSDFRSFTATPAIGYRRRALGEISLYGSFQDVTYPNRDLLLGPASLQDGYQLFGAGMRFDRRLAARIQATFRIGFAALRPADASIPGFNGLTYGVNVNARVTGRISAHLTFDRDIMPSTWQDVTYGISNVATAQVDYRIGPRLTLNLGVSQTTDRYHGVALLPGVDIQHDRIEAAFGGISYDLGRRIKLRLEARREARRADLFGYNYDDTQVALSAVAAL
jgi:hypothetical protein